MFFKSNGKLLNSAIHFVGFKFPYLFRFLSGFRPYQKRLLIIRVDAIGDYILFRNFIEEVKQSEAFKGYQVDLVFNHILKDLVFANDSQYLNNQYDINAKLLLSSPMQLLKAGWVLFKRNYAIVLQPSSTRTFLGDALMALAAGRQNIGFEGDTEGIIARHKAKFDKFYTQKLTLPPECHFEFNRNLFFFEKVLNKRILRDRPLLPVNKAEREGILIFPGAGVFRRRWEGENFLSLINLILQNTKETVYLMGAGAEKEIADYLVVNTDPARVVNLTNKLSLSGLIEKIGAARLVITNETSAVHIAVATDTNAVCIVGGGHFDRFAPYPDGMTDKLVCVYEKLDCYYCNWSCIYQVDELGTYPCVTVVKVDKVWQAVAPLLKVPA